MNFSEKPSEPSQEIPNSSFSLNLNKSQLNSRYYGRSGRKGDMATSVSRIMPKTFLDRKVFLKTAFIFIMSDPVLELNIKCIDFSLHCLLS